MPDYIIADKTLVTSYHSAGARLGQRSASAPRPSSVGCRDGQTGILNSVIKQTKSWLPGKHGYA